MMLDVLLALRHAWGLAGVAVVTEDNEARTLAREHGATLIPEAAGGLNAALAGALETLADFGAGGALIIHGDLPLATAEEVTRMLEAHPGDEAVTFVPARDGGTNAMLVTPTSAMNLHYGTGSYERHMDEARRRRLRTESLDLPGIGLDIDTPEDLRALLERGARGHTMEYLLATDVATRLQQNPATSMEGNR
jgi:2-phospho-L-lactate guanylyltransferase